MGARLRRCAVLVGIAVTGTVSALAPSAAVAAPYNLSQGITSFEGTTFSAYPAADLLPTFSFGGTTTPASNGSSAEPNVAVYPAQTASEPFVSGFAGSPGPLSGYCGASYSDSWNATTPVGTNPNETATPVAQPAGTTLPFAPYYFPYVVRNADGSLTGFAAGVDRKRWLLDHERRVAGTDTLTRFA